MRAAIIMGSTSDLPKVEPAVAILKDYGVEVDVRCLSAHRAHALFFLFFVVPVMKVNGKYVTKNGYYTDISEYPLHSHTGIISVFNIYTSILIILYIQSFITHF